MTEEDRAAYNSRLQALIDDMKPRGALELTLVQSVAHGFWRLSRAEAIEENTFAMEAERNENRIDCINPQITEALLQAMAFFDNPHTFALLTLYEQRIHRKLHKDLKVLTDLQAGRERARTQARKQSETAVKAAVNLLTMTAAKANRTSSTTYEKNGFVFSNAPQARTEAAPETKISPEPLDSSSESAESV